MRVRRAHWRDLALAATIAVAAGACSSGGHHATSTTSSAVPAPTTIQETPTTPASASRVGPRLPVFRIPASIRHDCGSDVTASVQAWIDTVPNGSELLFGSGACYRVDGTLELTNRRNVVVDGGGATLRAVTRGDRTRSQLVLSGGRDLVVRNLHVRGANPGAGVSKGAYHRDLEAQFAFEVSGARNVVLDQVQASDLYGDFVYIGPSPDHQPAQNVTVSNSRFARSGRQGISITDAVNVTISANVIGDVPLSLFDIEPNTASQKARSINIVGNRTGAAGNFWLADKGARADIGDIRVAGNRMDSATGGLIFVYARSGTYRGPFLIENNRLIASDTTHDEHSTGALFFAHAHDVTVQGNVITFPAGAEMPATEFRDVHGVTVSSNTFTNAGQNVLATQGTSQVNVRQP